jgi:hypothetical protein
MRRRASFRWLLILPALLLAGCMDDTDYDAVPIRVDAARPTFEEAAARTVAEGPAAIVATVRAGGVRYRLRGTWDPTNGYRLCARILAGPDRYLDRRVLWLEGRDYAYGTLTATGRRCRRERGNWFDDHPPTLELFGPHTSPGAEDHLHAALLALGGLTGRTVDFRSFDREPPRRDEDGWTLRPLLRRLGTRPVQVEVGPRGLIERLRLAGPRRVEVELALSRHGERRRVPHAIAYAIE